MFAIFQNEFVLYSIIAGIAITLLIARFVGLKKFFGWLFGKNTPEDRRAAKAAKSE